MSQVVSSKSKRVYREDTLEDYRRDVVRAIEIMHNRLGETLTVDDLADTTFLSRFHFIRVFTNVTGVSPARFLAAVRMQESKRLLLKTDRSVTDICFDVGYNSLGTFNRIFADFVGFPPVRFRQLSRPLLPLTPYQVKSLFPCKQPFPTHSSICGQIVCDNQLALITLGIFSTAIPRSQPIECCCLGDLFRFSFNHRLACGAWIFAVGLLPEATVEDAILMTQELVRVGSIHLSQENSSEGPYSIELRPRTEVEPPVVVAFPLLIAESIIRGK